MYALPHHQLSSGTLLQHANSQHQKSLLFTSSVSSVGNVQALPGAALNLNVAAGIGTQPCAGGKKQSRKTPLMPRGGAGVIPDQASCGSDFRSLQHPTLPASTSPTAICPAVGASSTASASANATVEAAEVLVGLSATMIGHQSADNGSSTGNCGASSNLTTTSGEHGAPIAASIGSHLTRTDSSRLPATCPGHMSICSTGERRLLHQHQQLSYTAPGTSPPAKLPSIGMTPIGAGHSQANMHLNNISRNRLASGIGLNRHGESLVPPAIQSHNYKSLPLGQKRVRHTSAGEANSTNQTLLNKVTISDDGKRLFRISLASKTRAKLDQLISEACALEVSLPLTRWLWQLHLASDVPERSSSSGQKADTHDHTDNDNDIDDEADEVARRKGVHSNRVDGERDKRIENELDLAPGATTPSLAGWEEMQLKRRLMRYLHRLIQQQHQQPCQQQPQQQQYLTSSSLQPNNLATSQDESSKESEKWSLHVDKSSALSLPHKRRLKRSSTSNEVFLTLRQKRRTLRNGSRSSDIIDGDRDEDLGINNESVLDGQEKESIRVQREGDDEEEDLGRTAIKQSSSCTHLCGRRGSRTEAGNELRRCVNEEDENDDEGVADGDEEHVSETRSALGSSGSRFSCRSSRQRIAEKPRCEQSFHSAERARRHLAGSLARARLASLGKRILRTSLLVKHAIRGRDIALNDQRL
ncbi:unnamed protein product [Protopolystoma xenopodis]|uniref:Uncharacterized protein n=1 Tax=Protopolystoma xenopodis TaxID=117903 RepID=A0A3S5CGP2_9PLAT|nr:unnamed protein product [Protopolystoma xenopodis]